MSEFLSLCSAQIVRSLLTWVPILLGWVLLLGVALLALCRSRFRHLARASGAPASRARVWTAGALLIGTQGILLPAVTLILATGFSLERGAANMIESASPRVLDWGMRTGTSVLQEKLSITDSTTVVDLRRLAPVLRKVAPVAAKARGLMSRLSIVREFASNAYVDALSAAADEAAAADLQVTWGDLFRSAHGRFKGLWTGQARIVASYLRASSLDLANLLAGVVVVVDALCVLAILALAHPHGNPTSQGVRG